MTPPFKNYPLWVRLAFTFAIFLGIAIFSQELAVLAVRPFFGDTRLKAIMDGAILSDTDRYIFLFIQAVASIGTFGVTAIVVSKTEVIDFKRRLGLVRAPGFKFVLLAVVAILSGQAVIEVLGALNQSIPLPHDIKQVLDQMDKKTADLTNALMAGTSIPLFIASAFVVAVVPAVVEELFFRGLIMGELLKGRVNPVIAIISSGLIFSLAHGEFSNLLAIWTLGSFLGLLYYATGSLKVSMVAHFTNNFFALLVKYLYVTGAIKIDLDKAEIPMWVIIAMSTVFFACVGLVIALRQPVDFVAELDDAEMFEENGPDVYA